MKMIQITSTGILSLILGVTGSAYAQHDQQGDKQDRPQEHQSQRANAYLNSLLYSHRCYSSLGVIQNYTF